MTIQTQDMLDRIQSQFYRISCFFYISSILAYSYALLLFMFTCSLVKLQMWIFRRQCILIH